MTGYWTHCIPEMRDCLRSIALCLSVCLYPVVSVCLCLCRVCLSVCLARQDYPYSVVGKVENLKEAVVRDRVYGGNAVLAQISLAEAERRFEIEHGRQPVVAGVESKQVRQAAQRRELGEHVVRQVKVAQMCKIIQQNDVTDIQVGNAERQVGQFSAVCCFAYVV